jgi:magnesium-transporting ATPase (P-type)
VAARRLTERGEPPRQRSSRSYLSIIRGNAVNIPNAILLVFGVLTITLDTWKDALFLAILVSNIVIGSFQEIRSKRALDRLAALVAPEAVVVRDGADARVAVDQVVAGDLVRLSAGDQVVADGKLVSADGLALDEANLTGESELVVRGAGEPVWSGSFAVEGAALFEATAVGAESQAEKLTATARTFRHPRSPLERANDRLLLWLVALSVPLAIGLLASVLTRVHGHTLQVQTLTAGLVNLVPEGLILLLSLTAAVSAFRVARLFLTKTVFAAFIGLAVGIPTAVYPLLPRQFTLASTVTIGVPAFLLALAPSAGPWRPERFLSSVSGFALTAGIPIGIGIVAGYYVSRYGFDMGLARSRTVATATVVVCGLAAVMKIEGESAGGRRRLAVAGLCALMALLFVLAFVVPFLRTFYELTHPTPQMFASWAIGTVLGVGGMLLALRLVPGPPEGR